VIAEKQILAASRSGQDASEAPRSVQKNLDRVGEQAPTANPRLP
jgi:hypothetical protein